MILDFIKSFFEQADTDYLEEHEQRLETIDIYRALVKAYSEILDAVFMGYRHTEEYTSPDHWLSLSFVQLIKHLTQLQTEIILQSLPPFNFEDYCNLEVNHETMIKNYPQKREQILAYRAKVEQLFYEKCKTEGNLPIMIQNDLKYYEELIQKHKEKRGIQVIKTDKIPLTLVFTAGKSKKKSIYLILEKSKNEWVDKKEIMKKVEIKYDDFRSFIAQLRDDIVKQGLIDQLRIDNDRKGKYKLSVLP